MTLYEQYICTVCKRVAVEQAGSNANTGWVRLMRPDRPAEDACPDHAPVLLAERNGRSDESFEVTAKVLHLAAQAEDGGVRVHFEAAGAALAAALQARRERERGNSEP